MDTNFVEPDPFSLTDYPVWLDVLFNPLKFEWSTQGLGMLRTYVGANKRLHIWHHIIRDVSASPVHNHPWDLESLILWGKLTQFRYIEKDPTDTSFPRWNKQTLHCGEGGGLLGDPVQIRLERQPVEYYSRGESYSQRAAEIHYSLPDNNTVTLITRHMPAGSNPDQASVYWKSGKEWGSAAPRPATRAEILYITRSVLNEWQERR